MSNTIETNKVKSDVFNMDCVEYMRTLPDNYFDIAICDPPYGDADSGDFRFFERICHGVTSDDKGNKIIQQQLF